MNTELYQEFCTVMQTKTPQEAQSFLVAHFMELPESVQEEVVMLLFEEGLQDAAQTEKIIGEFQSQGLEITGLLQKIKKMLDDKLKVMDVKESIDSAQ